MLLLFIGYQMLNSLMSTQEKDKTFTDEQDDPCDDCTDVKMSNLTGWITAQKKSVDKQEEE
jgi:hypothetical protein